MADFLSTLPNAVNQWEQVLSCADLLERMRGSSTAVFYLHGHYTWSKPWLTRLALRNGLRLTVSDVESFQAGFEGTDIYLYACQSGRPEVTQTRESLGLVTVFLAKDADAVLMKRSAGVSRADALSSVVREVCSGAGWLDSCLRFGCFVLLR